MNSQLKIFQLVSHAKPESLQVKVRAFQSPEQGSLSHIQTTAYVSVMCRSEIPIQSSLNLKNHYWNILLRKITHMTSGDALSTNGLICKIGQRLTSHSQPTHAVGVGLQLKKEAVCRNNKNPPIEPQQVRYNSQKKLNVLLRIPHKDYMQMDNTVQMHCHIVQFDNNAFTASNFSL